MALDFIYITCVAFLMFARNLASNQSRRYLSKIQKVEDDWMARAGGSG
jgi:hypothetical protein